MPSLAFLSPLSPATRLGFQVANHPDLGWAFKFLRSFPKSDLLITGGTARDGVLGIEPAHHHLLVHNLSPEALGNFTLQNPIPKNLELEILNSPLIQNLVDRDVTINSFAYSLRNGTIIDPLNGLDDLTRGIIRTNKESHHHLSADPIRLLRLIRLAAHHGFKIDAQTWGAVKTVAPQLNQTVYDESGRSIFRHSRQKIGHNILIGLARAPHATISLLEGASLTSDHLPEWSQLQIMTDKHGRTGEQKAFALLEHLNTHLTQLRHPKASRLPIILAGLVSGLEEKAARALDSVALRLHARALSHPHAQYDHLVASKALAHAHNIAHAHQDLSEVWARKVLSSTTHGQAGMILAKSFLHTGHGEPNGHEILARLHHESTVGFEKPQFNIRGRDLIAIGFAPGPALRSTLNRLKAEYSLGNIGSRGEALDLARRLLAS